MRTTLRKLFLLLSLLILILFDAGAQMRQVYEDPVAGNEIHKISFYSPSHGYVGFRDWIGFTADSGRTFTKKFVTFGNVDYNGHSVNLTFGFSINGVKAFSQDTLIAFGDYGFVPAILYSVNGGNTFKLVYHSQYNPLQLRTGIKDMIFPQNNNIGFAVDADRVLKTNDRGLTWTMVRNDPGSYFTNLEAPDNNNVYAFSTEYATNKVIRTTNSGINWSGVSLPSLNQGKVNYIHFLNTSRGWLSMRDYDNNYFFYSTTNGGFSWTLQNDIVATPFGCSKMKFVNDSTGYALSGLFTVYKTTNNGKVWEPLPRNNSYEYLGYSHNDLHIINNNQLWAGGGHGFLEINTNVGGPTIPKAFFTIDTVGVYSTGIVKLNNFSRPTYQYKWYVNNILVSTSYNATYNHVMTNDRDSVMLIVSNGTLSDTLGRDQYFILPPFPKLFSFSPASGSTGTFLTLKGKDFAGITSVKLGGVNVASYTVLSDTVITAIVGSGATGSVSVTNHFGTTSLPGFTYFAPPVGGPPVVNSFTPNTGPIGTVVTISGSNFHSTPANNIVYFGATKAVVTSASATQLVCTVPVGATHEAISVLNTATGQTGTSLHPFQVTFNDSANFTENSFPSALTFTYNTITSPKHVAGSDVDGDGKPDLVATISYSGDSISVYRNTSVNGNFSFDNRQGVGTLIGWAGPGQFKVKDIDGDGKPDIVGATNASNVSVTRNISTPGNIVFEPSILPLSGGGSWDVSVDDLDNDGKPDIAVANTTTPIFTVIRNTSSPGFLSFAYFNTFAAPATTVDVAIGDIDGDGKKDVVTLNSATNGVSSVSVYRNISTVGNIQFATRQDLPVTGWALNGRDVFLVDYDGDDKLDILAMTSGSLTYYRSTSTAGNISFAPVVEFTNLGGQGGTLANLSGKAKPDYVKGSWGSRGFTLLQNRSVPGTVQNDLPVHIEKYPSNTVVYYSNAADFNLDGKPDYVVGGSHDKQINIYKNNIGGKQTITVCESKQKMITSDFPGIAFQWQQDLGSGFVDVANGPNFSGTQTRTITLINVPLAWHNSKFRCVSGSSYSSVYVLEVTPNIAPDVTIVTPLTSICSGSSVTFSATVNNSVTNVTYQWQVNGVNVGGNSSQYTSLNLKHNDKVRVISWVNNLICSPMLRDTSNEIIMTVNGATPNHFFITPANPVCQGANVTFTATINNAGPSPTLQWLINNQPVGTNNPVFTTNQLQNGDKVRLVVTTSASACGPSIVDSGGVLGMSVKPIVTPSVSISTPSTTVCSGSTVTFTATAVNGGFAPRYQWKVNGNNVGANSPTFTTSTLANGDQVSVVLTSNEMCLATPNATSNSVTMVVTNTAIVPSVSIAASSTTICAGTPVTFTAQVTNGGSNPNYQWQLNGVNVGTNSATFTSSSLANNAQVKVLVTANGSCASTTPVSSNTVSMTVNPSPVANAGFDKTICATGTVIGSPAIAGYSYSWSPATGLSSATVAQPVATPTATTNYVLTVTNSNNCSATDLVKVTVSSTIPVAITASNPTICTGGNTTLTASGASTYTWSPATGLSATTGASVTASPAATTTYTVTGVNNGCSGTQATTVTVSPPVTPMVNVTYQGCPGNVLTFNANPTNGGTNPQYVWYVNNMIVAVGPTLTLSGLSNGTSVYVRMVSNAPCVTSTSAISPTTSVACITTGVPNVDVLETFAVSPNPTRDLVTVSMKLRQLKKISFKVTDSYGKLVYESVPVNASGTYTKRIDLHAQAQGIYFLKITIGKDSFTERVIIAR